MGKFMSATERFKQHIQELSDIREGKVPPPPPPDPRREGYGIRPYGK